MTGSFKYTSTYPMFNQRASVLPPSSHICSIFRPSQQDNPRNIHLLGSTFFFNRVKPRVDSLVVVPPGRDYGRRTSTSPLLLIMTVSMPNFAGQLHYLRLATVFLNMISPNSTPFFRSPSQPTGQKYLNEEMPTKGLFSRCVSIV